MTVSNTFSSLKMSKLVIDLPQQLVERIVSLYLDVKSIGRLDSALCIRSGRDTILGLLASHGTSVHFNCDNVKDIKCCMQWFILRKARLRSFRGQSRPHVDIGQLQAVFQTSAQSLSCVENVRKSTISALSSITGNYGKLKQVCISASHIPYEQLVQLLKKVEGCLESLNLSGKIMHTDRRSSFFMNLACPKVKFVNLSIELFHEENLKGFAACFPNLQELEVEEDCNPVLWTQLQRFPHLRRLSLVYISITDDSVAVMAAGCPHLTYLHLWNLDVSDAAIISVCEHCTQLETLEIGYILWALSAEAGVSIGERLGHSLTSLTVCDCDDATNEAIRGLQKCKHLRALDINGMKGDISEGLCELFKGCTELRNVEMEKTEIDDEVFSSIARDCPQLTTLSIAGCEYFTEFGVLALLEQAANLRCLTVSQDCPVVNALAVVLLKEKYPKLSITRSRDSEYV